MGNVGSELDHQLGERILWERKGIGGCGQGGSGFEYDAGEENEEGNITMDDGHHRE